MWDERDRDGKRTVVHSGVRKGFGPNIINFLFPDGKKIRDASQGFGQVTDLKSIN